MNGPVSMNGLELRRVSMPAPEVFDEEYLRPLVPIVIADLFAGDPLRALRTVAEFRRAFGGETIDLQDEYDEAMVIQQVRTQLRARDGTAMLPPQEAEVSVPSRLSLDDYLSLVERTRGRVKPRIAFEPPPGIRASFRVPPVCHPQPGESRHRTTGCFVGVAGSFSQLHFDKDGTHGLLYQVYGRKRVVVIPAEASPKLAPLAQYSAWCLQNMSDRERRAFLRFTGGWETVLEPGDAVYLPALCWHFADYLEPCFGLNIRFRRSGLVTRLLNELYPDAHAQALCAALSDPARAPLGRALLADVERVKADARARGAPVGPALRALAAELHERVCPGQVPRGPYALDLEAHFPTPLPQFLDPLSPDRPHYT